MRRLFRRIWAVSLAWPLVTVLATGGVGTACTDTKYDTALVEVERPAFNAPADSVNGFLGYYDVEAHQTTCGNCHADKQGDWVATRHAGAWEDLQASGHAQASCEGCHSVSELGNALVDAAGYNVVPDSTYFDVQCENCHGPGLTHVQSVLAGNVIPPLASIHVDTTGMNTNGCGDCHTGAHEPFVEQWSESKHGYGGTAYLDEGDRTPCKMCHEARGALELNFNVQTEYVEQEDPEDFQPIVCAVCHDPHNATNEGQLRAPLAEPSRSQICIHCHSREGAPEPGHYTRRGPHAAQGLLVIDEDVGWTPPGFAYDTTKIVGSHGTTANPRLCASCHVYMFDVTDAATGDFVLHSVGHTFEAIQCLDANGVPAPEPCTLQERQFAGCAVSGCHGDQDAARSAFITVRQRMDDLTDALWADTDNDSIMETTDGGLLPQVLAQAIAANNLNEINLYDDVLTPADGAIWNAQLAFTHNREYWSSFKVDGQLSCAPTTTCTDQLENNGAHKSSGEGVHNPFLLEALLRASATYLMSYYGLPAPPHVDLKAELTPPPGLRVVR